MKKVETRDPDIRSGYAREDLGHGIRGKHLAAHRRGTNLVLLRPDIAKAFPTTEAVNEALRFLMDVARRAGRTPAGDKAATTPSTPARRAL